VVGRPHLSLSQRGLRAAAVALAVLAVALPSAGQSARTGGYRIGPKDLVEIRVFEVPELNIERRVSEDGMVNLPLIGDVPPTPSSHRASRPCSSPSTYSAPR